MFVRYKGSLALPGSFQQPSTKQSLFVYGISSTPDQPLLNRLWINSRQSSDGIISPFFDIEGDLFNLSAQAVAVMSHCLSQQPLLRAHDCLLKDIRFVLPARVSKGRPSLERSSLSPTPRSIDLVLIFLRFAMPDAPVNGMVIEAEAVASNPANGEAFPIEVGSFEFA